MAESVKYTKYTFDQAFDGGAKSRFDIQLEQTKKEGEEAAQAAYAQGIEEGRAQVLQEIEAQTLESMNQISQAAHALFSQQGQLETQMKDEMVQLAYAIAAKLSPALLRQHPLHEVEALIEDCMATASKEPHLVVRVSQGIADAVNERIEDMKVSTNFPGDIVLIGEQDFGPQDCRVEWPDGGTERRYSDIQKEIESAVHRFVMGDTDDAEKQQGEAPDAPETDAAGG